MRATFRTRLACFTIGLIAEFARVSLAQTAVIREEVRPLPPRPTEPAVVVAEVPNEVALAGQILRTKQVDVRGSNEKFLTALLETADGQRQIVDLGPMANFRATPIYTGDQITVRGPRVTLGKLDVVLATQASVGGDTVLIKRVAPSATTAVAPVPAGYPVVEQVTKLDGRVQHLRKARLLGTRQEHLIAEVVTRGGRAVVVDLGPPEALWRADVKQGEWITIQGQEMNVNNRAVLLALEINKNGVPHLINRDLVRNEVAAAAETPAVVERTTVVEPAAVERTTVIKPVVAP